MSGRPVDPLCVEEVGHTEILLGNEAIVRGALEAGVGFASGYPGTPSSEITDSFARVSRSRALVFEYSVNEKVAFEMAFAASLTGVRSICAMKHLGLMVAGDPASTVPYIGVEGGMVVVSAGDPSCHTSPNEQDHRYLGQMLHTPVLDPSTVQEAYAFTRLAFELSEKSRLPVILRTTTRVCHARSVIRYGELAAPRKGAFKRNPDRYVPIPVNARRMRMEIFDRIEAAREVIEGAGLFHTRGDSEIAVLAAGAPAATCADILREHGLEDEVAFWTLGALFPLPDASLRKALRTVRRLLVVEELSPYLEDHVRGICAHHGIDVEILGKRSGDLPWPFEYELPVLEKALREGLGLVLREQTPLAAPTISNPPAPAPPRPPSLCPGCGHRSAFVAARVAFGDDQLYFSDIGCYTLGYGPPLQTADAVLCMGAGFTLAAGVARVTGERTIGFMGDSTFFHSGVPALLNAVKEKVNMVAIILDNEVTAMTGFQESPADRQGHEVSIEAVARALGVTQVTTVDPYDLGHTLQAFREARDASGVSVVIAKRPCPTFEVARRKQAVRSTPYAIDPARCRSCGREPSGLRCDLEVTEGFGRHLSRACAGRREPGAKVPDRSPCAEACPLSLCIQGYAGHTAAGEYAEALAHIADRTALPESVCRVCHRPCEAVCVRGARPEREGARPATPDAPVAINDLKRFVVAWAAKQPSWPHTPKRHDENGKTVAIVGAGPAGLAAAHALRLRGYAVKLFDARERPGGLLAHGIPAYRLPTEALERDMARLLELGVAFRGETRLGQEITLAGLLADGNDAIFLALGAERPRPLELKGAGSPGAPSMVSALDLLRRIARGEPASLGEQVVVVGGGNSAIDAARSLRRSGSPEITVACLEAREAMPAIPGEVEAAEAEGITLLCGVEPLRLEEGGIVFRRIDGELLPRIAAGQIVVAIGQTPDPAFLGEGDPVLALDEDGCLLIDPVTGQSSHPKIFAGGDFTRGTGRMVTEAMASGERAAHGIDCVLQGDAAAAWRVPPELSGAPGVDQERGVSPRESRARHHPAQLPVAERLGDFVEITQALSEEAARAEASRCLSCGSCGNCRVCIDQVGCPAMLLRGDQVTIDAALCTGCGLCALFCPNGAIRPQEGATREEGASLPVFQAPYTQPSAPPTEPVALALASDALEPAQGAEARFRILLTGVGGQGVLTAAQILGIAAHAAKVPVVVGQLHGMSQRGGSVQCSVLLGPGESSFIADGRADVVLGFEPLEVVRTLSKIGAGTTVLTNTGTIVPFEITRSGGRYPQLSTLLASVREIAHDVLLVDGPAHVASTGVRRTLNVVMLGALAGLGLLPLTEGQIWDAIERRCHAGFLDANRKAFELGHGWAQERRAR